MKRTAFAWLIVAAASLGAQERTSNPAPGNDDHSSARGFASLVHLEPSAFLQIPARIREALERRECRIPESPAAIGDTSAAGRVANLAVRRNVLHGQFFERGKFAWAVICSAHGSTSIVLLPDDDTQPGLPKTIESENFGSEPDSTFAERDPTGGWGLNVTIFVDSASGIDRTHDGAKLDRAERARPVHDGIQIADMLDGSGFTIYWTGRRWIQVRSYD